MECQAESLLLGGRLSQAAALLCLYLAIEAAQGLLIIRMESRNHGEVDKSRFRAEVSKQPP